MNNNTVNRTSSNVIAFVHPGNFRRASCSASLMWPDQRIICDSLSIPDLSPPANDEAHTARPAPKSTQGRQARLLRMWAEILAEDDLAAN